MLITGCASFRMLAGLCLIVVQAKYWLCLVSDAAWIVLDDSTSLVLAVPPFACWLDCA